MGGERKFSLIIHRKSSVKDDIFVAVNLTDRQLREMAVEFMEDHEDFADYLPRKIEQPVGHKVTPEQALWAWALSEVTTSQERLDVYYTGNMERANRLVTEYLGIDLMASGKLTATGLPKLH